MKSKALALVLLVAFLSSCGSNSNAGADIPLNTLDVAVTVQSQRDLGPLNVTASSARKETASTDPWMRFDLSITNSGDKKVQLGDTRDAVFVGDKRLLVADAGCGPGQSSPDDSVSPTCATYAYEPFIEPGQSNEQTLSLHAGLKGMSQLKPGKFSMNKKIQYRSDGESKYKEGRVEITYEVKKI